MNTGGPAFPHGPLGDSIQYEDGRISHQWQGSPGMDLLDWFAGQALEGLLSNQYRKGDVEQYTADAYTWATAMLAKKARREALVQESSTTDHSGEAGKMIPDPFAEDALRQLASDVLPADIKDAASEERLTWCAEQVRAQVNTLEAQNRELVERIKQLEDVLEKAELAVAFANREHGVIRMMADDYTEVLQQIRVALKAKEIKP